VNTPKFPHVVVVVAVCLFEVWVPEEGSEESQPLLLAILIQSKKHMKQALLASASHGERRVCLDPKTRCYFPRRLFSERGYFRLLKARASSSE